MIQRETTRKEIALTTDDLRIESRSGEVSAGASTRLSPRATWRLALGLLIAGGALGWFSCALPWATVRVVLLSDTPFPLTEEVSDPALTALGWLLRRNVIQRPALTVPVVVLVWFLFLVLGLAIALMLITRHRPRVRVALLLIYALWVVRLVAPLLFISATLATGRGASFIRLTWQSPADGFLVGMPDPPVPAPGLWLGWLAALLGGAGLCFACQALRRGLAEPLSAPTPRAGAEVASAGLATAGVVVWEVGFFALPWATQGCSGLHFSLNHYLTGTCFGLDSADMLARWSMTNGGAPLSFPDNPLVSVANTLTNLTLLSMLVAVVTLWALARLWIGPRGAWRYSWLLTCLILSGALALLAWRGAADALIHPGAHIYGATAPWVYGPGVLTTFVGLAAAALGLVGAYYWSASASGRMWPVSSRSRPSASSVGEKM